MKTCPAKRCRYSKFATQSAAKMHYKEHHSMNAILCISCNKPISTHSKSDYILHYRRKHKNVKNPFDLVKNTKRLAEKEVSASNQYN